MHTLNRAHTDGPGLTVLTAVCDRAPHLAGLLDLDGRIVHASPRTCALVGCTLDDVRDRAVWDSPWWAHDTQAQVDIRDGVARARHAPVEFETTHRNTLGEIRAIDLTLIEALVTALDRRLAWSVAVSEGEVFVSMGETTRSGPIRYETL